MVGEGPREGAPEGEVAAANSPAGSDALRLRVLVHEAHLAKQESIQSSAKKARSYTKESSQNKITREDKRASQRARESYIGHGSLSLFLKARARVYVVEDVWRRVVGVGGVERSKGRHDALEPKRREHVAPRWVAAERQPGSTGP